MGSSHTLYLERLKQAPSSLLADHELVTLLGEARDTIPRARQVFVNRNLRLGNIGLVGFDMDYTLALYRQKHLEQLSFDMTLHRLIARRGYPPVIASVAYEPSFVMRGLVVDKHNGNLIKMDRFGHVGRAYHGRTRLPAERWKRLYRHERIRLKAPQYAWIDTLFALPEACLYAGIIDVLDEGGAPPDYARLYDDIRETIDEVHRDGSLKAEIQRDVARFVVRDPELPATLHKLRSGGKRLFLLTNSEWSYTDAIMRHLLDGASPEYPSWRHFFDMVVCAAQKPAFFSERREFLELEPQADGARVLGRPSLLERGRVYTGGNLTDFERLSGFSGDRILYVGDHIYGDILKSKKTSLWRTCLIVQELEDEILYTESCRTQIERLSDIELFIARLDDEVGYRKTQLNAIERELERPDLDEEEARALEAKRRDAKRALEIVRRSFLEMDQLAVTLEREVEEGYNATWGLMFKEGTENSRFGEQVEQYACIYTSRVSNLLRYSPMQYFRSPREQMPHEQAGALSGKLSPLGGEGPPKGAIP